MAVFVLPATDISFRQVRTFQGTIKQTLTFAESEGEPKFLDINAHYLAVATTNGNGSFSASHTYMHARTRAHTHEHVRTHTHMRKNSLFAIRFPEGV